MSRSVIGSGSSFAEDYKTGSPAGQFSCGTTKIYSLLSCQKLGAKNKLLHSFNGNGIVFTCMEYVLMGRYISYHQSIN